MMAWHKQNLLSLAYVIEENAMCTLGKKGSYLAVINSMFPSCVYIYNYIYNYINNHIYSYIYIHTCISGFQQCIWFFVQRNVTLWLEIKRLDLLPEEFPYIFWYSLLQYLNSIHFYLKFKTAFTSAMHTYAGQYQKSVYTPCTLLKLASSSTLSIHKNSNFDILINCFDSQTSYIHLFQLGLQIACLHTAAYFLYRDRLKRLDTDYAT